MNRIRIVVIVILALPGIAALWKRAEIEKNSESNFRELTAEQKKNFEWTEGEDEQKFYQRFTQNFLDTTYIFPRQPVSKVVITQNSNFFNLLPGETLKTEHVKSFVRFFNDTANFDWGETTWEKSESEFICKLYDANDKLIGKIYFSLKDCGMTSSVPYAPRMKFGGLTSNGMNYLQQLISDKRNWQ